MRVGPKRRSPLWLRTRWETKKQETTDRVAIAVQMLAAKGRKVTVAAICDAVRSVSGRSISANTIKRNPLAYEIYLKYREHPRVRRVRDAALEQLYQQMEPDEKAQLRTKVSRLRRESKDSLIARVVRLERMVGQQTTVENNLRDEVIRLRLISLQATSS